MIYPIVKYGDPVLETPAAPVTEFDDKLKKLVEDMFESMYEAQGVGLAAPQIGISLHLSVIDTSFKEDPEARLVLANPRDHQGGRQADRRRRMPFAARLPRESCARQDGHHPGAGRKRQLVREDRRRPAGARLSA